MIKDINKLKNKLIILLIFIILAMGIYLFFREKKYIPKKISNEEAYKKITRVFGKQIKKINNQALVLSNNKNYMIMVVDDRYLLVDFSQNPPKVHHYQSNKPDIKVKILEIYNDGSFLVEHDDHTHRVYAKLPKGTKSGDYVYIKDPHTYLYDNHHKDE